MKSKKVLRYYADCGRGFWKKGSCLGHEKRCKCWTNPKYKTCLTCKFHNLIKDSNGMEEPYRENFITRECNNANFDHDRDFRPAHENAPDLCIDCEMWESKSKEKICTK